MSLYTSLTNAISGLNAFQRGTQIVTENIGNVNNESYRKRREVYADIGTAQAGVFITEIERITDRLLQQRVWDSSSARKAEDIRERYYQRLSEVTGTTDDTSYLTKAIEDLVDSFVELEASPETSSSELVVYRKAQAVEEEFERVSSAIFELRNSFNREIVASVSDLNDAIADIADLNKSILQTNKRQNEFSQLENLIEQRIDRVAEEINVRVFRDEQTGVYRVYSRDGSLLIADTKVGLQAQWSAENDQITNTMNGFDITAQIPEGGLKAQIDFVARQDRTLPNGTEVSVTENQDIRLGVLSKYENQLDELARMFVAHNSSLNQGSFIPQNTNGTRSTSNLVNNQVLVTIPTSEKNTFVGAYSNTIFPSQVHVAAADAVNNQEFFADRLTLRDLYTKLRSAVADSPLSAEIINIDLTESERQFFASYQGVPAVANQLAFNLTLDQRDPADPPNTASRADVALATTLFEKVLYNQREFTIPGSVPPDESSMIPGHLLFVKDSESYVDANGNTVNPTISGISFFSANQVVENINRYLNGTITDLSNIYNLSGPQIQHEIGYLMNNISPSTNINVNLPTLNLSNNQLTELRDRFQEYLAPYENQIQIHRQNNLNPDKTVLEKYWKDKIFVPSNQQYTHPDEVDRFNITVQQSPTNAANENIISAIRKNPDVMRTLVDNLLSKTRSIDSSGANVSDEDYASIGRALSLDFVRKSQQIERGKTQTKNINDSLDDRLKNETGVNIDQELSRLIVLQNSYGAAARMITTINSMFDALEATIR